MQCHALSCHAVLCCAVTPCASWYDSCTVLHDTITSHEQDASATLFSTHAQTQRHRQRHTDRDTQTETHTDTDTHIHTQQTGQCDPTCSKVIIAFGLPEQQGAQSAQHFKEDPTSSIHISLGRHTAALPLLWRQILGVHLRGYPTLCSPAEAMHGQITFLRHFI